jgi:hypothetical protein
MNATGFELPFEYHLEREADVLILRWSDSSFVAALRCRVVAPSDTEEEANEEPF